jgi:hypothetical protein
MNSDLRNFRDSEIAHVGNLVQQLAELAESDDGSGAFAAELMANFSRFVRTMDITRFLTMYELYQRVRSVQGSFIEIGVLNGFNLFNLAHFTEIHEPRNYTRTIIGFDTFEGYPDRVSDNDRQNMSDSMIHDVKTSSFPALQKSVDLFNASTLMNQFERISLVKGDVAQTIPQVVDERPELIVSLLLCLTDLYEPTKLALEYFLPLMPKGAVVAFAGLNWGQLPGESVALKQMLQLNEVRIERLSFNTKLSFFTVGS